MCFTRVNRLYSVLKKYGSSQTSQYHNKFCDLFAALSLPKVLNIQNLPLHMLTDPTYQRFLEVSCIWHRRFVHCVGFLTMSSLLWRPKKLTFYTGFYSKNLHSPLCSVPGIIYLLRSQPKDKAINEQLTWRMIFCRYLSHRRENKFNLALKRGFIECFTLETHPII